MPGSTPLNATPNGCQPGFVQPSAAALTRELNAARARWAASGIRTYRYTFSQVAAPVRFPATEVTVSAGRVLSARPTEPGEASAQARRASVEGLFTFIEQSVAYARTEPCTEIRVTYARAGYPLTWSTEPRRLNIADGNGFWAVTGFTRR